MQGYWTRQLLKSSAPLRQLLSRPPGGRGLFNMKGLFGGGAAKAGKAARRTGRLPIEVEEQARQMGVPLRRANELWRQGKPLSTTPTLLGG